MKKNFDKNTTIKSIIEMYLTQENMSIYKFSKENKLSVKTIEKILKNTNSNFHKKTLEKIYKLKNLKAEDKKFIKEMLKNKDSSTTFKARENFISLFTKFDEIIEENNALNEKIKVLSIKEDDNYFSKRKIGAFNSDIQSNSLLITKIWNFNEIILKEWADVKLLIDINDRKKTKRMKKGLKGIAENLKEISNYLENIYFDIDEDEEVIILNNNEE
ncbi:hypothetical protein [Fusobacterium sp.]|uniref:hypothetical protein n=1 Tax=Fusobacterium sp. TaxID=68766 RepID=UPI0025BF535E|nr:hypothetical protein [Fusobacterium sp.]MCI7224506.1 hypothetical protein [Fusobacterium sp.]